MTTTDLYALCPCGSGKKTKFCCRDIIGEIEKIQRMLDADQRQASLDKIERLLLQHPNRPALLTLRARVLSDMGKRDEAEATLQTLLEVEPTNIHALSMKGVTLASSGNPLDALPAIHQALGESKGMLTDSLRRSFLYAIFKLSEYQSVSTYVAAHAHLEFLVSIPSLEVEPGEEDLIQDLLTRLIHSGRVPAIVFGLQFPTEAPTGVTWRREFEWAKQLYEYGNWSGALRILAGMNIRILDEPTLLRAQALLQLFVGQVEASAKSWRMLAAVRGLPLEEAALAEGVAMTLSPPKEDLIAAKILTLDLQDDLTALIERLLSDNRASAVETPTDNLPSPQYQFLLYDRGPQSWSEATEPTPDEMDELARLLGSVLVIGQRTDTPPQLTILVAQDSRFAERVQTISDILAIPITPDAAWSTVHQMTWMQHKATMEVRMTRLNLSSARTREVQAAWVERQVRRAWADVPSTLLHGKTPRQAAQDPKLHRVVLGLLLVTQLFCNRFGVWLDDVKDREELGLPPRPPKPSKLNAQSIPGCIQTDLSTVSDDELAELNDLTIQYDSSIIRRRVCEAILARPSLEKVFSFVDFYINLGRVTVDSDQAIEILHTGRDFAIRHGQSPSFVLITELAIRIERGESEIARQLLMEIQTRHGNEPRVRKMLDAMFAEYGPPRGQAKSSPHVGTPQTTREPEGIWTPESEQRESPGQLWVPGMD